MSRQDASSVPKGTPAKAQQILTGSSDQVRRSITTQRSWASSIFRWGIVLPLITIGLAVAVPALYKYSRLQHGQSFAIITNSTIIDMPENVHSRWRGPDYIQQYDRFFFQWWNFLVYDAETHDHWTVVYHTTKFSKAANYDAYAMASIVHRKGPNEVLTSYESIPLDDLVHKNHWDLEMKRPDGTIPHTVNIIDDDTYNVVANLLAEDTTTNVPVSFNLTFHRVHGMYSGFDAEKRNEEHCAIMSTLFGYHSKVSGWIQEGEKRWTFGTEGAAGNRYRAYAAGSWGCKLPAGYPEIQYPWTWIWLTIPGDATASPPRPEIGMAMGTARFQLNVTALGDLYGGFASVGVGDQITTATFATLHHNSSWEVPLTKVASDDFLKLYENGLYNWTEITDLGGKFNVPLVQTYDVETAHHRFQLTFHTKPEQYFRLPVVVEHLEAPGIRPEPRRLAVFSDFRACGVRTEVKVWRRKLSPAQQLAAKKGKPASLPAKTASGEIDQFVAGGWDEVVYDGEVDSLNAIEFAYQAPVADREYEKFLQPQKFVSKRQQKK